ncbi:MAG: divalent-cation tolerance protein CutA [Saprospiraceae bacterium]|nr:divalent-cation tolerance protein CutA [Saprospiraceae bacterium]MBK6565700.1 divalent-cation tolerance protein CutA [Saprospiraceae bacterium]MBK7525268.1 divalent-cation tolerance protein CutA [Saprospiraceae bacterium]MBK8370287.1 divalent-cation tolerance protein CutA [Saprospiraceae bacterium]MBK8546701.1 divalent-cation tolerance protein CutA [Saprospiraceae bacterium]
MDTISVLYVTFPDEETAKTIGKKLLDLKLIACINILPIQSLYLWQNVMEEGNEMIGLLKTRRDLVSNCIETITQLHPYTTPCILNLSVEANKSFFDWVNEVTTPLPNIG